MTKLLVVLIFAFLATSAYADEAATEAEKVVSLTAETFDDFISKSTLTLVEFYAPWCGHCKALAPEYEKAAHELEGKNAGALAKVDCTAHRDLCSKYDVSGFPTIKLFRNDGSEPSDYESEREADALVKFMVRQSSPTVTELADAAAIKGFATTDSTKVVAFLGASDSADAYTKTANALRNDLQFGLVRDNAAAAAEFKASIPSVVFFRDFDEGNIVYPGDVSNTEELTKWIKDNSFPLVGEIGPENYAKYAERGLDFVWIFAKLDSEEHKTMVKDVIAPTAADFRDKLSFVHLDAERWGDHAKGFGLSGNAPGIAVETRETRKNYLFPEDSAITKDAFHAFIDGVLKGTVAAHLKSEDVPETNDGPVKVIVGKTFEEIVMDDTKDVLVEFYAPWCGHCKSLAPKYEKLGELFKDDATAVIAKIDATANDSPAEVQGFPTLILYPAGDKKNTVEYSGERNAAALSAWFKANGKAGGRPDKEAVAAQEAEAAPTGTAGEPKDEL